MLTTNFKLATVVVLLLGVATAGTGPAGFGSAATYQRPAVRRHDSATVALEGLHEVQAKDKAPLGRSVDWFGDPLPAGASARLGTLRWRHAGMVGFTAFTPDGKGLVTADDDAIFLWEFPKGKLVCRIDLPIAPLPGLGILKTGLGKSSLPVPPKPIALSADGKIIACYLLLANKLLCFDVATGKLLNEAIPKKGEGIINAGPVSALAFSPNGEELTSLDLKGNLRVLDWRKGLELHSIGAVKENGLSLQSSLAYAPDGKSIACIRGRGPLGPRWLEIWDASTGKAIHSIPIAANVKGSLSPAVWSPDGKTLAFSTSKTITFVDAVLGKELVTHASEGRLAGAALHFSKDGNKLYSQGLLGSRVVGEWDVGSGKLLRTFGSQSPAPLLGPGLSRASGMSLSPDGNILCLAGLERLPVFIDLPGGKETTLPGGHSKPVLQLQFSPDSKTMLTMAGETNQRLQKSLRKWDVATGKDLGPIAIPDRSAHLAISPDGQTLAVATFSGNGKRVALIDSITGKELREIAITAPEPQMGMLFSNDGKMLAIRKGQQGRLELYEVSTAKLLREFSIAATVKGIKTRVAFSSSSSSVLFFSPDGKKLAAFVDQAARTLGVWDSSTGRQIGTVTIPKDGQVVSGVFSPESRSIVLGMDDGSAVIYEVATWKQRTTLGEKPRADPKDNNRPALEAMFPQLNFGPRLADGCFNVAFSPDGKLVAHAGLDNVVRLWDAVTGKSVAEFRGHLSNVQCVAFSPNGRWLASGSADTTTLIWDVGGLKKQQ